MRMFPESRGYATQETARKALEKALALTGRTLDEVQWLLMLQDNGRIVPVVRAEPKELTALLYLVHKNICVIG